MQMVLLESLNAQSFLVIRSCTSSLSQIRQERFGIIHIMVGFNLLGLNLILSAAQLPNTAMAFVV